LDNSTKFKAFEALDVSDKNYCLLPKYCTLTVKTAECDSKVNISKTVLSLSVYGCILFYVRLSFLSALV